MLWSALGFEPAGVFACVGAGGKTSLIQSLAAEAVRKERPVLVTATTKMFYDQIAGYRLLLSPVYTEGTGTIALKLQPGETAAWFAGQEGSKVVGVSPQGIDEVAASAPDACILVEADGARRCLIKAPAVHEPVIPDSTVMTIGVLNLTSLGRPLTEDNAHRLELVTKIVGKQAGAVIEWQDLAKLAIHRHGIFQHARGTKVLLLSGAEKSGWEIAARQVAGYVKIAGTAIERVVITAGFGSSMQVNEVYLL